MDTDLPASDDADERCPSCGAPVADAWLDCRACGAQLAAPAELPQGALLGDGRYQILATIGRGGFGITYEAGDTRLRRRVAVKELFPDAAVRHGQAVLTPPHARPAFRSARERFIREARVLARFTHPGIVRVYEVFEEHGTAYLVMERLGGRTLIDVLRARGEAFTEEEVLDVAVRVASALRPVHAAGVLHRDLNPSNVMLTEHGRIVLIDFGLARDFDPEQTMGMTQVVTPGYAPLEQYRGEGRFGPWTDVYGLAATCYRLATGRVPVAAMERSSGTAVAAPHRLNPGISKRVSDAILDGLELEPSHRPQDLDALLARLQVRAAPTAPRSVLLGRAGAMPDDLEAPGPLPDLPDPGPATGAGDGSPGPTPDPPPDLTLHDDERTVAAPLLAVAVPGDGAQGTSAAADAAGTAPSPTAADPDRTVPGLGPVRPAGTDGDATAHLVASAGPDPTVGLGEHRPRSVDPLRSPLQPPAAPTPEEGAHPNPLGRPPRAGTGRDRPGRRKVVLPLVAVAGAATGAAPVLGALALVLVVLPALATFGDATARHLRAGVGEAGSWAERSLPVPLYVLVRQARNAVVSVVRSSPIIGVAAVLLALWYAVEGTSLPRGFIDATLRIIGIGTALALCAGAAEGSDRFRSGLGLDELVRRGAPEGRTTERLVVCWVLAVVVVALAFWLAPDPFPLP